MGHDIFAYRTSDYKRKHEIAYLRRSSSSLYAGTIYNLLRSRECYGGSSGWGVTKRFFRSEIEGALQKAIGEDIEPERKFLKDILEGMEGEEVDIFFS